jgi:hypothetical protein
VSWTALTGATAYDLVAGGLLSLRGSGGNFTTATQACLADDTPLTNVTDGSIPAAGDGRWYLLRGLSCGGNGTYDSGDPRQVGSRDSEINASTNACP